MTEFKLGDIVRITKGEPDKPGWVSEVREVVKRPLQDGQVALKSLAAYKDRGWTVELVERPAPSLPTKPNALGWATWKGTRRLVRLGVFGQWEAYNKDGALVTKPHPSAIEDFEEAVLIPKELADRVIEWGRLDGDTTGFELLVEVAERLKEQNDE